MSWILVLLLSIPAVLAGGKLNVTCKGRCTPDEYEAIGSFGNDIFSMKQDTSDQLEIDKSPINATGGKCWEKFTYRAVGQADKTEIQNQIWAENNNDIKKVIQVYFGQEKQPSKCQNIEIYLYINLLICPKGTGKVKIFDGLVNPLQSWMEDKDLKEKDKRNENKKFPKIEFKGNDIPIISWEEITSIFKCDALHTKGSIEYRAYRIDEFEKKITKQSKIIDEQPYTDMFVKQKYPTLTEEEKCHFWNIEIDVELKFYNSKSFSKEPKTTFTRETKKTNPSKLDLKVVKKNNVTQTETYLKIEAFKKIDLKCLNKEATIKQWSSKQKVHNKKTVSIVKENLKTAKINLGPFLDESCVESQIIVNISSISEPNNPQQTVTTGLIQAHPELECSEIAEDTIKLNVMNEQFQGCEELKYRIICAHVNSTSPIDFENFTEPTDTFTIKDLHLKQCNAIAFIKDPNEPDQWLIPRKPTYCTETSVKKESVTIPVIVAIISLAAAFGAAYIFLKISYKKRKARKRVKRISIKEVKDPHFVIKKKEILGSEVDRTDEELDTMRNDQIKETLRNLVEQQDDVVDEFNKADEYSRREIVAKETTEIAKTEINKFRNRYTDMVPYDSNILHLKVNTGNPPSTYMNASHVKFEGMKQDFVAIQAPKPPMFGSFWQSVWDQDVSVIVMITGLIEGGRTKAHQYWPDKDELIMEFGQVGLSVKYINHSYPGTYYHRKFILTNDKGKQRKIDHLQTNEWADMTAPKSTKILLDLLYKTDELMDERTGPIMVHCSAGVGRTGTYIGLYKLVSDYNDDNVEEIDFYQTLIEMRRQRMMMVQKPLQYHYMIKCLADYVARETSDYA